MEKSKDTVVKERINGKHQGYKEMINLIGIEGSLINLLFSIKKYIDLLSPLEVQYYRLVKIAHARKDNTATIEDVNQLYKILQRVRSS